LDLHESWHVFAVNLRRIGEVSLAEIIGFARLEDVSGFLEVEGPLVGRSEFAYVLQFAH
jgi:hypothetical protein